MPVRRIARVAAGITVTPAGGPNFNSLRVDPSTDTLVFGTSTSGTTEKTVADLTSTQTLTNKTLTNPTINGSTQTGAVYGDDKVLAASATFTTNTVAATLSGFSWTVVPGTYLYEVNLPSTMTTNGGATVSFALTTTVLTSIQYQFYAATASDQTTAISGQGTTATTGTKVFDSKAAAFTLVNIKGSMVVGTGGTFAWQVCQNTSNSDTTTILLGSYASLTRVA